MVAGRRGDGETGSAACEIAAIAKPRVKPEKRKYLVTDPGFLVRYVLALATIGAAMAAAQNSVTCTVYITELYDTLQWNLLDAASDMSMVFLMGMLSSSCCLVQILLSAMSLGCAGFNTYLGPARPALLALTSAIQLYNWQYVVRRGWAVNGAIASSSATVVLALLPEMLEHWARRQLRLRAAAVAADDAAPPVTLLEFQLSGMGCVSCVKAVSDTLVASQLVTDHDLDFEAEHLRVWVAADTGDRHLGATSRLVVAELADAGFTATPRPPRPPRVRPPGRAPVARAAIPTAAARVRALNPPLRAPRSVRQTAAGAPALATRPGRRCRGHRSSQPGCSRAAAVCCSSGSTARPCLAS